MNKNMTNPLPHSVAPRGQELPDTYIDLMQLLDALSDHFPEFRECLSRAADEVDAHERRTKRITEQTHV